MNLSKLKEARVRKKFDKEIFNLPDSRIVSQNKIKSVGILTTESISSKINLASTIEKVLGVRNVKIYSFKKFDKADAVSFKHFSEKEVNWKGAFTQPDFNGFLEQPFDLLIGYFNENNLYLEKAVLASNATFKTGFSNVNAKLYELEITGKTAPAEPFLLELKKYLKILKKLKN